MMIQFLQKYLARYACAAIFTASMALIIPENTHAAEAAARQPALAAPTEQKSFFETAQQFILDHKGSIATVCAGVLGLGFIAKALYKKFSPALTDNGITTGGQQNLKKHFEQLVAAVINNNIELVKQQWEEVRAAVDTQQRNRIDELIERFEHALARRESNIAIASMRMMLASAIRAAGRQAVKERHMAAAEKQTLPPALSRMLPGSSPEKMFAHAQMPAAGRSAGAQDSVLSSIGNYLHYAVAIYGIVARFFNWPPFEAQQRPVRAITTVPRG